MAHKSCLHGLDPESCAYCSPKGSRKSGITHIAPPPDYVDDRDERDLYGVPEGKEEEDLDDIEPAEAAFAPRAPKSTRVPLLWDLRESDTISDIPLAPKAPKPTTRLSPPITPEEEGKDRIFVLRVLGNDPITIARELAKRKVNRKTGRQIADDLSVSDACVSKYLALLKLSPKLQAMMDPARPKSARLSLTVGTALASLPPHLQEECAQEVLRSRWTVNKAARYVRMRVQQERARARELSRPAG